MPEIDAENLSESVDQGLKTLFRGGWEGALKTVLFALLVLMICLIVKRVILRILDRGLDRGHVDRSFHGFIRSGLNVVLWFVTIMIVAELLGINATSLVALVSIAGLAVSLSVQDTLANLAGGLTILATHPFKVGDYVVIGSTTGTIREIGMVYTKLTTLDNRRIVVPNSIVADAEVTNYSTEPLRRVDLLVSASYDAPVELVKKTLQEVMAAHEKVLLDPPPFARVNRHGDSAMEYAVRAWCENGDYWDVYHDLLEQIKEAFDREGITIPYPQMEVAIKK
ncbi:MAG: mechanosensitive ion channel family protein [Bacillota bacterium]|nr:mechanosensitive ion channel family protein [Bacillota bacterium]